MLTLGKFVVLMLVVTAATGGYQIRHTKNVEDRLEGESRSTMPLVKLGQKFYYFGTYFQAIWFKAFQFCRAHGMFLASVTSQEENENLIKYIDDLGYGTEHFWLSGTDVGSEGKFFWMSTGAAISFSDWRPGSPDNYNHNGEREDCLHIHKSEGPGPRWNDARCSLLMYFICESF